MKKSSKASLTTQYIVTFGAALLLANFALGFLLLRQSSFMVQGLIRKSMVSISNTAADLVDGDALGMFTEEDVGTEPYMEVYRALSAFQNNADIEYIYAVRQSGEGKFIFTVDPDPVEPGEFGEEVLVTEALLTAARGIASVDDAPAEDRWGNFYSSYSPVFDSYGRVSGIIGVDFNADWYNQQVWNNTTFIILFSVLFTLLGVSAFFMINGRVKRRFNALNLELAALSSNVESLTEELLSGTSFAGGVDPSGHVGDQKDVYDADDEIRTLGRKIHTMHKEMELYLDYVHAQVYTDTLTRVGNTTAYLERQKALEAKILDGSARFSTVMFDINDLKHINDRYGHACGDKTICAAASVIAKSFGKENTFRIGGDEFLVITEGITEEELEKCLARVDELAAAYNGTDRGNETELSISMGHATYVAGHDHSFRDVFVRADQKMYEKKDSYHRRSRTAEP